MIPFGTFFAYDNYVMADKIINCNLRKVIKLCNEMLELADHGDKCRTDAGCGVVYGTLRDAAYKMRRLAKNELAQHDCESEAIDVNLSTKDRKGKMYDRQKEKNTGS